MELLDFKVVNMESLVSMFSCESHGYLLMQLATFKLDSDKGYKTNFRSHLK